eukprot:2570998-Pleurochrysis_carterae.AAC.8
MVPQQTRVRARGPQQLALRALVVGDAVAQKENLRRQCAVLLLKLEQALRDAGLEFGKRLPKRVKQGAE